MSDADWMPARLAPLGVVVETKIHDKDGDRNHQRLIRHKTLNLWLVPDGPTYVYYTPTHFREVGQ